MNSTQLGLITGLALALIAAVGGFGAFLAALVLGAAGLLVGRVLDGRLDISRFVGRS
ncbi:hypothetical protein [Fodinicola acaciae]|uniref:hypothetical protein n=1 Tax=Fodinicola acaciae TaxID=2681555 RepID=UPI0013D06D59|nr:hypothetical protein [Fodinicola acaciae]